MSRSSQRVIKTTASAIDSFAFSVKGSPMRDLFEVSVFAALGKAHLFGVHRNALDLSHLALRLPELAFKALAADRFHGFPRVVLTFFSSHRDTPASVAIECQIGSCTSTVDLVVPDQILGLDCLNGKSNAYTGLYFNTCKGELNCNLHELLPALSFAFERALDQHDQLVMEHKQKESVEDALIARLLQSASQVEVLPGHLDPCLDIDISIGTVYAKRVSQALEAFGQAHRVASPYDGHDSRCFWSPEFLMAWRAKHIECFGAQADGDFPPELHSQFAYFEEEFGHGGARLNVQSEHSMTTTPSPEGA